MLEQSGQAGGTEWWSAQAFQSCKRVLVVGAGVAGLQTARALLRASFRVLVLEEGEEVGGVWRKNYDGYGIQVPWELYQFPEYPMPKELRPKSGCPVGSDIHKYVISYAQQFQLYEHIKLGCKLTQLTKRRKGGWKAMYQELRTGTRFAVHVEFVVFCTGVYTEPFIPECQGVSAFQGSRVHAKSLGDDIDTGGKDVVIVGAGKTAMDCVSLVKSTNTAASVTLLYRQAHWPLPRNLTSRVGTGKVLHSRAFNSCLPTYYTDGLGSKLSSACTWPFRRLLWKAVEHSILRRFPVLAEMKPPVHLPMDLLYSGQIVEDNFEQVLQGTSVSKVKGSVHHFERGGLVISDGTFIKADVVIYCTGYTRSYNCFDSSIQAEFSIDKDGLYLYRQTLSPTVPAVAFVGCEVTTFNNILTSALQAQWLVRALTGKMELPSVEAMLQDVQKQKSWRRKIIPSQRCRSSVVNCYMQRFHDQLVEDMGLPAKRKGWNPLSEYFEAYTARDYTAVVTSSDSLCAPYVTLGRRRSLNPSTTSSDHESGRFTGELPETSRSSLELQHGTGSHTAANCVLRSTTEEVEESGPSLRNGIDVPPTSTPPSPGLLPVMPPSPSIPIPTTTLPTSKTPHPAGTNSPPSPTAARDSSGGTAPQRKRSFLASLPLLNRMLSCTSINSASNAPTSPGDSIMAEFSKREVGAADSPACRSQASGYFTEPPLEGVAGLIARLKGRSGHLASSVGVGGGDSPPASSTGTPAHVAKAMAGMCDSMSSSHPSSLQAADESQGGGVSYHSNLHSLDNFWFHSCGSAINIRQLMGSAAGCDDPSVNSRRGGTDSNGCTMNGGPGGRHGGSITGSFSDRVSWADQLLQEENVIRSSLPTTRVVASRLHAKGEASAPNLHHLGIAGQCSTSPTNTANSTDNGAKGSVCTNATLQRVHGETVTKGGAAAHAYHSGPLLVAQGSGQAHASTNGDSTPRPISGPCVHFQLESGGGCDPNTHHAPMPSKLDARSMPTRILGRVVDPVNGAVTHGFVAHNGGNGGTPYDRCRLFPSSGLGVSSSAVVLEEVQEVEMALEMVWQAG